MRRKIDLRQAQSNVRMAKLYNLLLLINFISSRFLLSVSGNSSYFIESNTQYLSFNADSFRSTDFYEPANNNLQQSAPDDNKLIEVDTFNLSIVESPARYHTTSIECCCPELT